MLKFGGCYALYEVRRWEPIFSRIEERGTTNTKCLRATSDKEAEKIGPIPEGCGENRAIFDSPQLWNTQPYPTPRRLTHFSRATARSIKCIAASFAAILLCGTVSIVVAQQTAPANPGPPKHPNATVLFSRSDDQPANQTSAPVDSAQNATDKVTDAGRAAVTFTSYDLDIHLALRDHSLAARAQVEIRNDGPQPLNLIPLQLSSSLDFEAVSLDGHRLSVNRFVLNSDTDHTGLLHEAVVQLPAPLAPKATLHLEITYSGTIERDARRLIQLGTPDDIAAHSDWDRISEDFTGLRGFGNVVWYPVSSVPDLLGDGNKVFAEIGKQKLRQSGATVSIRLTIEYYVAPPTVVVLDGHSVSVPKPSIAPAQNYPGVITCALPATRLGFATPTIFLASWAPVDENGLRIFVRSEDQANVQGLTAAATMAQPLVTKWLGADAKSPVTIIDLPEPDDLTWLQDSLLVTAIISQPSDTYADMMSNALAHANFQSPHEWLNEGVPNFLETLWIERNNDRTLALQKLEPQRTALAFAEPASPGDAPGEPLLHASDPVYYRTKATYVLWMLRDLIGEKALAAALQTYNPAQDTTPDYFQKLVERASGPNSNNDLQWFFDNWVYNDRGLPDLSIADFHSSPAENAGQYLVAIDISNDGFAEAEVSVTVRSQNSTTQTDRVLLPGKTRTVHRMLVQGQPVEIIVNDGTVPEVAADIHKRDITDQPPVTN